MTSVTRCGHRKHLDWDTAQSWAMCQMVKVKEVNQTSKHEGTERQGLWPGCQGPSSTAGERGWDGRPMGMERLAG